MARPRWVQVLDTMPVTNVGKIYKPELRQRAACQAVQGALAVANLAAQAHVQADGDNAVRVTVEHAPGADPAELLAHVRHLLAPLPLRITVAAQAAPA